VDGLINGCHLEMPGTSGMTDDEVCEAVRGGKVGEALLDERVDCLLALLYDTLPALGKGKRYSDSEHDEVARDAARRSFVLLKNDKGTLPLGKGKRVAIIGDFARKPRYQGSGSSFVNPVKLTPALGMLQDSGLDIIGFETGFKRFGGKSRIRKRRAVSLARRADVTVLFLGLHERGEAEGRDRKHMMLPENQTELLAAIRGVCDDIVVVLSGGAPVEAPWADMADSILHTYLGGQAAGAAVADIITGKANPSGKLAESYPHKYGDSPAAPWFHANEATSEHRESIFIGYRYFDTAGKGVVWPFGHGLSYTTFEYSGLSADTAAARFSIRNTGGAAGEEIAQIYVSKDGSSVFRADKELKGFAKVALEPGESKQVCIEFDNHAFKYFDAAANEWVAEPGGYRILVGASSRDIRLEQMVCIEGAAAARLPADGSLNYFSANVHKVADDEFETLLGRPLPPGGWDRSAPLGHTDLVWFGRYRKGFGRFMVWSLKAARRFCLLFGKPVAADNLMFMLSLRFNQLARMSNGMIDMPMLDGILTMVNGRFWKGFKQTRKARKAKNA
jgi:beta-glucosidase